MLENTIISGMVFNENYTRKVIPYIKEEYFTDPTDKLLYSIVDSYFKKYNAPPSKEVLIIELNNFSISQDLFETCEAKIKTLELPDADLEWLVDSTEKFCQDRAIFNAIHESIQILDNNSKKDKGAIPQVLSEALAVSFDESVGHDYISDYESRYEMYHETTSKIPFSIDLLNRITDGGLDKKTLNIILAGTGVGKSMFMCSEAAFNLMDGKNVLYITLEMSQQKIAERIDANLFDVPIKNLKSIPKELFKRKIDKLKEKQIGKLIIKEYPTSGAHAGHFRFLIQELKIKKNFVPDIIYIDYLNICSSSRQKPGVSNSYTYIKSIAEELRGLAVEFNVPIVSATQVTRGGFGASDIDLTDTSESFGLPATADLMFAVIMTDELEEMNQVMIKQLKNRYGDLNYYKKFFVGRDASKMRFYNIANDNDENDKAVFDVTNTGEIINAQDAGLSTTNKRNTLRFG